MTDIEIPQEAVKDVAEVLAMQQSGAMWELYTATPRQLLVVGHMPTARLAIAAALPALRRQWGEEAAKVVEEYDGPEPRTWRAGAARLVREYGEAR